MTEQEIAAKFVTYRDSLGTPARRPVRKRSARPLLVLSPVAAAAAVVVGALVLPGMSNAATLSRLKDAITNAASMESRNYLQDASGKWMLWEVNTYSEGKYRSDLLCTMLKTPVTFIYRDNLCYEILGNQAHATVRPSEANPYAPKLHGEALDVIEQQLYDRAKGSDMRITQGQPVDGRATYQVHYDRTGGPSPSYDRHIVLIVDQDTNLPISADLTNASTWGGAAHWDFEFNVPVPDRLFQVARTKPIVDLRKTIPAFEKSHRLTNVSGLDILDACVTDDGTIWIVTGDEPDNVHVQPGQLEANTHEPYTGAGICLNSDLSKSTGIIVWGFAPLDASTRLPTRASISFDRGSPIHAIPNSDNTTASRPLGKTAPLSVALRHEPGHLPSYFSQLGLEDQLVQIPYDVREARADANEKRGHFAQAAALYEKIGDEDCKPESRDAYLQWMGHAATDYHKAGLASDEARVNAKADAAKSARH